MFLIFSHFLLYVETPSCEQVERKQPQQPWEQAPKFVSNH